MQEAKDRYDKGTLPLCGAYSLFEELESQQASPREYEYALGSLYAASIDPVRLGG